MKKMATNLDDITSVLKNIRVFPNGVSFAGKSLKLDTEQDAKSVTEAIGRCSCLEYLNLEGNTLGVEAARAVSMALEEHPEFKRALWKDMFTGRMKTEIPKALEFLGEGLVKAGARLSELDLSDNAFGPIGVEGLAALLRSPTCFALEELRLNNNGLGITGGKLLATALTDCYNTSKQQGKPLSLKVFIAGRNRLENDGATSLAKVFRLIGTLEEVAMPQNGIYHVGITALSDSFTCNKNLQILNLNDNTIGEKGAKAISAALPKMQNLKQLNFGDCLLKTKGAIQLAKALEIGHDNLEVLNLGHNEINKDGAMELVKAIEKKAQLKSLILNGNSFGDSGISELKSKLANIGKLDVLGSLSEDESEDDEAEKNSDDSSTETGEEESDDEVQITEIPVSTVTVDNFLNSPSADNYLALGTSREELILNEIRKPSMLILDEYIPILMKVAALASHSNKQVSESSLKCAEMLYEHLFIKKNQSSDVSLINNAILVNLGLIKSEDKKFKPTWNLDGCLKVVDSILNKNFVPQATKDTLKVFRQKQIDDKKS